MTGVAEPLLTRRQEGFTELDGRRFYVIPDLAPLAPFLMSLVSESDHWCFISSAGALTAGRRNAGTALFPYETDDRLHRAAGLTGPATVLRVGSDDAAQVWEPFGRCAATATERAIAKTAEGDVIVFEEVNRELELAFRFRWATSDQFGFVRKVELANIGGSTRRIHVADGILNVLPDGLAPEQYLSMSNLTNAYRRSELIGGPGNLALHTLEALIVDQPMPAEALRATVTWSLAPGGADVTVDSRVLDRVRTGDPAKASHIMTGRPGAHVVMSEVTLAPGESSSWFIVADVAQDHADVACLQAYLAAAENVASDIDASMQQGSDALRAKLAAADAIQNTADERASSHHAANVLFNIMRGGVFAAGYLCSAQDFARFVSERNLDVAQQHAATLADLPPELGHRDLVEQVASKGDPDLERLALEYLPLSFSRRHGDPSRPWNQFSIRLRESDGTPILRHEGNWRDIFQNWEALSLSFPHYLPSMVTVFVNASTADGFNPYRITRGGFEWETPDPDDPWSNIGYWGDHQIVYLHRLLEAADRSVPGAIDHLLDRMIFTYADVPYRLKNYDDLVDDPRSSIRYDDEAAGRTLERSKAIGGDGRLLFGPNGDIHRVSLIEKLLVAALGKLSCYVPGGGIWMNTQRPEWNDANNALVGYGLSMVTLCHLRRYLSWLSALITRWPGKSIALSAEVASWLTDVIDVMQAHHHVPSGANDGRRASFTGDLGRAFSEYRSRLYTSGLTGTTQVAIDTLRELCAAALPHLDSTIRESRRDDGLYHSYNLIRFSAGGARASVEHLPAMLEGQVAILSSGILSPAEAADVIDALYASALYRPDQDSFILYPDRRPPSFLEKNAIPEELVASNPLLTELLATAHDGVIAQDVDGLHHFDSRLHNAAALEKALDRLAGDPRWSPLVEAHRPAVVKTYETVFHHHAFTGRSGTMYAYEGLGSIYWHMVAKLMVATQECVLAAHRGGADPEAVDRLRRSYYRIRGGLGFNKTAAEFGAFPTDPYSHTPAHAGAQQPGMTGQVKEEILTRFGELGVWFDSGGLCFDPVLLRRVELLTEPAAWSFHDIDGQPQTIELAPESFGLTVCQVPVIVAAADVGTRIEVVRPDGSKSFLEGTTLDRDTSREIFARSGAVAALLIHVPRATLQPASIDHAEGDR